MLPDTTTFRMEKQRNPMMMKTIRYASLAATMLATMPIAAAGGLERRRGSGPQIAATATAGKVFPNEGRPPPPPAGEDDMHRRQERTGFEPQALKLMKVFR